MPTTAIEAGKPVVIWVREEYQIAVARREAQHLAEELGFGRPDVYSIATSASELASNLFFHAIGGGSISLSPLSENGCRGIEILAADTSPGIADIDRALQDGYSSIGGLGGGLPGVRRLMDSFEIESTPGRGTRVRVRKWRKK